ncbi:protein of unknown function [Micropruina glycogenica]|uniref:Uncharacterized protein n=1 Tax=Micropruina glycogenica TaxID=75385 RepID=A0A2N9JLF5_9ACTN|nr:protein of unknown function [Micropruina glycogenica]
MADTQTRTLDTHSAFSLREAALFGFGHRAESDYDGGCRPRTLSNSARRRPKTSCAPCPASGPATAS